MLRNSIAAGAFAAAFAVAPVMAADMPMPDFAAPPAPAPAPSFYDWTGVYGGLHAGYAWGDYSASAPALPRTYSFDGDGFLAGGQIGANWQIDQFVFGIEGDLSWADMDGSTVIPATALTATGDNKWLATIRGRAGIAIENVLIYGTAGAAFTRINQGVVGVGSDTNTHTGWTVGAGLEIGLTENVSVRGEYLYTDFGNKTYNLPAPVGDVRADYDAHVLRAGINYRFNMF